MRKSSAIRAAMRLRKWCNGRACSAGTCVFCSKDGACRLFETVPALWPAMSFEGLMEMEDEDATD